LFQNRDEKSNKNDYEEGRPKNVVQTSDFNNLTYD
jgi:hypothetical protein